ADGSAPQTFTNLPSGSFSTTQRYVDNLPKGQTSLFTVVLALADDDGATASASTVLFTLNNLPPTLTSAGFVASTINENGLATLTATLADPGPLDTFSLIVDWADGSTPQTFANLLSGLFSTTHRYLDDHPHEQPLTY